jgi:predicted transcriptional regulator of viral defense system
LVKSTYISAHLTDEQRALLQALDDHEVLYFSLDDLHDRVDTVFLDKNELVENLYQKGFLNRIERGVYARPQFIDIHALATFISHGGAVAYWSALHLQGLTERFPNKTFIKTGQRKRPTKIMGTQVQFVTVKPYKLREGIVHQGYGDKAFPLTDPEVTLIDCFNQPSYASDWPGSRTFS